MAESQSKELIDVLASIGSVSEAAKAAKISITGQQSKVNEDAARLQGAQEQQTKQAQELLLAQREQGRRIMEGLDLDPDNTQNAIVRMMQERTQLDQEQRALYQEVRAKQNVSFFDDPLGWFEARYTLNDSIHAYNTVVERKNAVTTNLDTLDEVADSASKAAWFGLKYKDERFAKAEADAIAFNAMKEAFDRTQKLASFNISAEGAILSTDERIADMKYKALQARNSEEHLQMQRESHKKSMAAFDKQQKDQKFMEDAAKELGNRFYGGADISVGYLENLLKQPGREGITARWLMKSVITKSAIGESPGEAIIAADYNKIKLQNPEQDAVKKVLSSDVVTAAQKASTKTPEQWKALPPEEQASLIDKYIKQQYKDPIKNNNYIVTPTSIYSAPSLSSLVEQAPYLKDTILYKEGLAGSADDKKQLDANMVRALVKDMVKNGKYGPLSAGAIEKAAADVNRFYRDVNTYTASYRGLDTVFGMPTLLNSHRIQTGASMLSAEAGTVDMVSRAEVVRDIAYDISSSLNIKLNVMGIK